MPRQKASTTNTNAVGSNSNVNNSNWVQTYLHGIGLSSNITTNFAAAGIVTPSALAQLEVAHFSALGVTEPDDCRKLFFLVQRVRQEEVQNTTTNTHASSASTTGGEPEAPREPTMKRRSRRLQEKQKQEEINAWNAATASNKYDEDRPLHQVGEAFRESERERTLDCSNSRSTGTYHDDEISVQEESSFETSVVSDKDDQVRQLPTVSNDDDDELLNAALATPQSKADLKSWNLESRSDESELEQQPRQHLDSLDSMDKIVDEVLQPTSEMKNTRKGTVKSLSSNIPGPRTSATSTTQKKPLRRSQLQAPNRKRTTTTKPTSVDSSRANKIVSTVESLTSQQEQKADKLGVPWEQEQVTPKPRPTHRPGTKPKHPPDQIAALRAKHTAEHHEHSVFPPPDDSRIRVVVRKRPPTSNLDILHAMECCAQVYVYQPKQRVDLVPQIDIAKFAFDQVFDEHRCNREVYELAVRPVLPRLVETGDWVTVVCYGQTGSGKTHTMVGKREPTAARTDGNASTDHLGLYAMAALDIFHMLAGSGWTVQVSMLEIHNGKLWDLLLEQRAAIPCWEDGTGQVCFPGLSEHPVTTPFGLMEVVSTGFGRRATGSTSRNADSSRSHAIVQIHLYGDGNEISRLTLMDLAGSERASDTTYMDAATRAEGAEINTSLLALKEVIRALAVQDDHVPYRGSKLTQVLKGAFSERSQTVLIACVAPDVSNCEPTLNTLRYADRIRQRDPYENRQKGRLPKNNGNLVEEDESSQPPSLQSKGSGAFSIETTSVSTDPAGVLDELLATPQAKAEFVAMYTELIELQHSLLSDEMDLSTLDKDQFDHYIVRLNELLKEQLATIEVARELVQKQRFHGEDDDSIDLRD